MVENFEAVFLNLRVIFFAIYMEIHRYWSIENPRSRIQTLKFYLKNKKNTNPKFPLSIEKI